MLISLEFSSEVESKLRESAMNRDADAVRRLVIEAVMPAIDATVEALLRDPAQGFSPEASELTDSEFDSLLDEIANMYSSVPTLPDTALTREGIYEAHP